MQRSITHEEINESKNIFKFNTDEDITVIWFDDKIDLEIKTALECSHDRIQICCSLDEMIKTVEHIGNEKIILIVAGRYSRETLTLVHDNEKIDSIYIFCFNSSLYQGLLNKNKYSKLVGIYTEYKSLFSTLKQQIHLILKQLSVFNLFSSIDTPMRDLECESANYLWYQLFRDTLMTMHTENERCKQELIDFCRSYYRQNKTYRQQIDTFQETYKSLDAIY